VRIRPLALVLVLSAGAGAERRAHAQAEPQPHLDVRGKSRPVSRTFDYSPYERESIQDALKQLHLELDPEPEGKRVEGIDTVRLDVVEKRDPLPGLLNVFHVTTRDYVIDREVLLRPGDEWAQVIADETARNLRALPQLSLVLVLATRGRTPGSVRALVITKDIWSLRLEWDVSLPNLKLEQLSLNPSETNLFGRHQTVGARFDYRPESVSIGGRYYVPRLFGTRVSFTGDANVIINTRAPDPRVPDDPPLGSFGSVGVQKPLWSTLTEWSWGGSVAWRSEVTRRYSNAEIANFRLSPSTKCGTPSPYCVPWRYDSNLVSAGAFVTRSFGWDLKHDFSLGFAVDYRAYQVPDLTRTDASGTPYFDAATVDAFTRTRVPLTDHRVGPYVQYRTYSTSFLRVTNSESFALQEDYRIGHDAYVRVYPVFEALGSSRSFVGVTTGVQYGHNIGDGFVRVGGEALAEIQTKDGVVSDAAFEGMTRLTSPRFFAGRMVFDTRVLTRPRNYLQRTSFLGGDGRLRGYPTSYLAGKDVLAFNLEYRSRPLQLWSMHAGGVLFYDVGDAFDGWKNLSPKQSAGFGVRALFPQFNRIVFRVDVGFPLTYPLDPGVGAASVFVSFEQAFAVPAVSPASALSQ
jgi:hypothetical protein